MITIVLLLLLHITAAYLSFIISSFAWPIYDPHLIRLFCLTGVCIYSKIRNSSSHAGHCNPSIAIAPNQAFAESLLSIYTYVYVFIYVAVYTRVVYMVFNRRG